MQKMTLFGVGFSVNKAAMLNSGDVSFATVLKSGHHFLKDFQTMTKDEKETLLTHCGTIQLAIQLLIIELNATRPTAHNSPETL